MADEETNLLYSIGDRWSWGKAMKRRDFITLLGGAAAAWPLAARGQQVGLPLVGVLRPNPKDVNETFAEPFRRYMKAIGWEEGRNIRFQFVWMEGRSERAPSLADELVAQKVDIIIPFGDPAIRAAQRATQSIPIVAMTDDMIGSAFVASMAPSLRETPQTSDPSPQSAERDSGCQSLLPFGHIPTEILARPCDGPRTVAF
jgi:ABC-type uncharacterized transport system substrate-binding protein